MATLSLSESTRSTQIDLVLRPQSAMALSAARDFVVVSGRRRAVLEVVSGEQYALAVPCGPTNGPSQQGLRRAAAINPSTSIPSTTNEGVVVGKNDDMGAFATSLGRPPSPPV
jgi:hypothetical protein